MDFDSLTTGDFIAQFLNFAEFPLPKLLLAILLGVGTWFVLREIFDKRMAEMRWIGNGLFCVCVLAFWYLILTLLLGYSEPLHGLFTCIDSVLKLVIEGIAQLLHMKPHGH